MAVGWDVLAMKLYTGGTLDKKGLETLCYGTYVGWNKTRSVLRVYYYYIYRYTMMQLLPIR